MLLQQSSWKLAPFLIELRSVTHSFFPEEADCIMLDEQIATASVFFASFELEAGNFIRGGKFRAENSSSQGELFSDRP